MVRESGAGCGPSPPLLNSGPVPADLSRVSERISAPAIGPLARPATGSRPRSGVMDRWDVVLTCAGVGLIAFYVATFAVRNAPLQADFRTYVAAGRAALAGIDPYSAEHLSALAHRETLPFVYPPVTLRAFAPLAALPGGLARALWMALNVAILAGLVASWRLWLGPGVRLLPLALAAVFGWNASALWGLRTGNVALIEAALIWLALVCYARGRRGAFAALIVAAACFKLAPALFLLLLLVPRERERPHFARALTAVAILGALVLGPTLLGPAARWEFFLRHLPDAGALGSSNPGALGFFTVLAGTWGLPAAPATAGLVLWGAFALALAAISVPFVRGAIRDRDPRRVAMAALFLYVLIEPRPMAYGFLLLTPAAFFFAPQPFARRAGQLALAILLSAQGLTQAANHYSPDLVYVYAPFLIALCVWLLVVNRGPAPAR